MSYCTSDEPLHFINLGKNDSEDPVAELVETPVNSGHQHGNIDESFTAHQGSNVNVNRFTLPKDARELIVAVILAASLITNLYLWQKVHDADKDIQTQVWLRDDALTKFEQGPFADMKAHVIALELNQKEH